VFSKHSDVWSFGVVVWEIASGQRPFADLAPGTAAVAICKGLSLCYICCCNHLLISIYEGTRLEKCEGMPRRLWTLVNDCWRVEANDRPDAATLLSRLASLLADEGRWNGNK
jgi:serine/threonine protein kinase